jgi:hypothetical protein
MRDLVRDLECLRDDLARTQREITILEQVGRELRAIVDRDGDARTDMLIRNLDEIAQRTALAVARQTLIARMMGECGRECSSARFGRAHPTRRPARAFARPIAGRVKSA